MQDNIAPKSEICAELKEKIFVKIINSGSKGINSCLAHVIMSTSDEMKFEVKSKLIHMMITKIYMEELPCFLGIPPKIKVSVEQDSHFIGIPYNFIDIISTSNKIQDEDKLKLLSQLKKLNIGDELNLDITHELNKQIISGEAYVDKRMLSINERQSSIELNTYYNATTKENKAINLKINKNSSPAAFEKIADQSHNKLDLVLARKVMIQTLQNNLDWDKQREIL